MSGQEGIPELPPGLYDDVKAVALRLALIDLNDDDELARQGRLTAELLRIAEGSPGLLIGIISFFLGHFTQALERGYGSRVAAIDEVTRELAAAILAAGDRR